MISIAHRAVPDPRDESEARSPYPSEGAPKTIARTGVVLIHYKNAQDTAACLASLRESHCPIEVLVVDNTPGDSKLDALKAFYPRVQFCEAPRNLGFGCGNNFGVQHLLQDRHLEFILFLNNDATVVPDAILRLEEAMDAHPEAGISVSRIVFADQPKALWYGGGDVNWRFGGGKAPGYLGPADAPLAMTARYVPFATGCAMLTRTSVLRQCGGFDPRFFMYEEDLELSLRVTEHEWRIWYEPASLVVHRCQGSLKEDTYRDATLGPLSPTNPNLPFYAFHIFRNRCLCMLLHAHGVERLQFLCVFPLFSIYKALLFLRRGRFDAIWAMCRAIFDALLVLLSRKDFCGAIFP